MKCILFSNPYCNGSDMVMKINIKKYLSKILFVWAGFFFVALQMYIFVLAPQIKEKKRLGDELAKISERYQQAQDAASEADRMRLNKQIDSLKNEAGGFAVSVEDSANLTFDISRLADQLKLSALAVKTRGDEPIQNCSHICENRILINFTSAFNQFFALINALERHRPVVFVDTFSITRPSQQVQEGNEVTMELAVFVTKPLETSNKVASKNKM